MLETRNEAIRIAPDVRGTAPEPLVRPWAGGWWQGPALQLRLLGQPEVLLDWTPISFAHDRTVALLALLAVTGPQSRAALAALLAPEDGSELAPKLLSNSLTELRQQLGDYIEADRSSISLSAAETYALDTRELEAGPPRLAGRFDAEAAGRWIDLYRGDFLEGLSLRGLGELQEWSDRESERLRAAYVRGLRAIARAAVKAQDSETAMRAVKRMRTIAPWDAEVCARRAERGRAGLAQPAAGD
jgi:DNA-binding SARP family transcriptional activator